MEYKHNGVIGAQWGDEGKGKVIDYLGANHDIIVRCQGGNNAGHTVVVGGVKYAFHLLPSGIIREDKICVLGNGLVIDPGVLVDELDKMLAVGKPFAKLYISDRAHIITSELIAQDKKKGGIGEKVGSTGRGIGPTYSAKVSRTGKRMCEFIQEDVELAKRLKPYVIDTADFLWKEMKRGQKILFEGAQATLLDIDHGTYPCVTSSNCTVGGLITGSGVRPHSLGIVGVAKAYTTRVGEGPFVTELDDIVGETLRTVGSEYGTTTGRPRRCGWLDTVVLNHSKKINNLDSLALTKLDVLSGLDEIKICVAYEINGQRISKIPAELALLKNAKGIYETMDGWKDDITKCRNFDDLPENAQLYVDKIEELTNLMVDYIGVGPGREELIVR